MKQQFKRALPIALLLIISIFGFTSFSSCQKRPTKKVVDYGDAPRKPVPKEMVGTWMYTSVSNSNMSNQYGHNSSAWAFGATFKINADGTGWEAIYSSVTTYSKESKETVESDGTYEIEVDNDNNVSFKYYAVQGKVYDNDIYMHGLAAEKLYPQKFYNWKCTLGSDSKGVYFNTGDAKYYKTEDL